MDSPSHIRPLFGNTPVTAARSLAASATPKKKRDTHVETTSSSEGWTTKDYFLYGTAGLGALGAVYAGQGTFRPAVGKLIALASGNKPPPLPSPPLSPASRLYAKITSALDYYLKPLVRGTAVLGGAGLGAMMLGPSALLRSGEREAVRTETAAGRGRTRSLSLSRQSSNPNAPRRITRSLSLSSASGRGRSTEIRPLDSSITSAISAIRPSTATPPPNPSSLERSGNESNQQGSDTPHFSLKDFWQENNSRPNQRQGNASTHLETQPPSSSESHHSSTIEIDTPPTSEDRPPNMLQAFWAQNGTKPNHGRTTHQQQASISGGNVANSSDSSPVSPIPENNFLRDLWKDLNRQEDISSRQSVHNTHSSTSVSSSESLGSTSSLPHDQNLERPARSPEQENQELLNHLPCPLSIPENSEPLLASNHSLPTRSNSVKGKEKEVKQVETPHPDDSRDSANLPFSPDELSSRLQQIKRVNSFNGESSSSASSSAFNSQVSTGLINMEKLWDSVDGTTTPPLLPVESPRDTRSPFVVSPSPSSTPSVYATPDRGRSTTSSTAQTPFFTPRGPSPVRESEHTADNRTVSSQRRNLAPKRVKRKKTQVHMPPKPKFNLSPKDPSIRRIPNVSSTNPVFHAREAVSLISKSDPSPPSTGTSSSSSYASNGNYYDELFDLKAYDLTASRNPENLRKIVAECKNKAALTTTLHRICEADRYAKYATTPEIDILVKAGASVNQKRGYYTPLISLLRHYGVDFFAVKTLLEAGADPRIFDEQGRTAMKVLLDWQPSIIMGSNDRALIDKTQPKTPELVNLLEEMLNTYAEFHDALNTANTKKILRLLEENPDLKFPLPDFVGDPEAPLAERLLFNLENSTRVAEFFGEDTPEFIQKATGVPLDVEGFSEWAKTLDPPLSYRVADNPEIISSLQQCLGKTEKETKKFINKVIENELYDELNQVSFKVLQRFTPEQRKLNHWARKGLFTPAAKSNAKEKLVRGMARRIAQQGTE